MNRRAPRMTASRDLGGAELARGCDDLALDLSVLFHRVTAAGHRTAAGHLFEAMQRVSLASGALKRRAGRPAELERLP